MDDASLLKHLLELLRSGHAHTTFDQAIKGFPPELRGKRPAGVPYSAWELLEHMRIAQNDILRFSKEPDYESPAWPQGYWPPSPAPKSARRWNESVRAFRKDLASFERLLRKRELDTPFPWGQGQTLLREALLIADHNAYHLGQLVLVRRLLKAWP